MKLQHKKLTFKKDVIIELNDKQINKVNGGSWTIVESIIRATTYGTWLDHGPL
ncbi:class I lanthipeptide [Lacinutrix sp.]|uniref:class I lanthipeptide n=1 Tax=Lacinutrix sp. TaxID=1937692 RepID=UPI0025B7EDB9|nr:class I lanthipeptide [Lacinutrix sp.]